MNLWVAMLSVGIVREKNLLERQGRQPAQPRSTRPSQHLEQTGADLVLQANGAVGARIGGKRAEGRYISLPANPVTVLPSETG